MSDTYFPIRTGKLLFNFHRVSSEFKRTKLHFPNFQLKASRNAMIALFTVKMLLTVKIAHWLRYIDVLHTFAKNYHFAIYWSLQFFMSCREAKGTYSGPILNIAFPKIHIRTFPGLFWQKIRLLLFNNFQKFIFNQIFASQIQPGIV